MRWKGLSILKWYTVPVLPFWVGAAVKLFQYRKIREFGLQKGIIYRQTDQWYEEFNWNATVWDRAGIFRVLSLELNRVAKYSRT